MDPTLGFMLVPSCATVASFWGCIRVQPVLASEWLQRALNESMSVCNELENKNGFCITKKGGGGAANSINEETSTVFLFALNCTVRITLMFWEMIVFQIKPWDLSLNSIFCSCRIHFTMSPRCTVPKPWGIDVTPLDERCLGCEHRG